MASTTPGSVLKHVHRSILRRDDAGRTDGTLLECFITQRDEAAFETLVRRHGPMVLGVCRRVLSNEADAEDAFQATFLVLVKRAGSIRPRGMVGNWLYGVARNTARKAKLMSTRMRARNKKLERGRSRDRTTTTGNKRCSIRSCRPSPTNTVRPSSCATWKGSRSRRRRASLAVPPRPSARVWRGDGSCWRGGWPAAG